MAGKQYPHHKTATSLIDIERAKLETCRCGHSRVAHAGLLLHGHCFVTGCDCLKFTWASEYMWASEGDE